MTFLALLNHAKNVLNTVSLNPEHEASTILCEIFSISKATLLVKLHETIDNPQLLERSLEVINTRSKGVPLPYILGYTYFRDRRYTTPKGVFIPRMETEILVDTILTEIRKHTLFKTSFVCLELGVGTGVISIELAKANPRQRFMGWDSNPEALKTATKNAEYHGIENIQWIEGDFFKDKARWEPIIQGNDPLLFVSNPPYIPQDDIGGLDDSVKVHEPHSALTDGEKGLSYYERLFELFKERKNTLIGMEFGIHQRPALAHLLEKYGYTNVQFIKDYQGIDRVVLVFG